MVVSKRTIVLCSNVYTSILLAIFLKVSLQLSFEDRDFNKSWIKREFEILLTDMLGFGEDGG